MTIQHQFEQFDRENPHVYDKLVGLAIEWLDQNASVGMKMLWERLRWEFGVQTTEEAPRLNNNYTSRYARKLLADFPEWGGRIKTRELQAA
ncbi:MAG TPA: hypothetical protein PLQ54_09935 [Armatimonadota bacterium]|nr:hypothetical protein [Armatimonadota bacterium]